MMGDDMPDAATKEGIIKYELHYTPSEPLPEAEIAELNAARKRMFEMKLIGQDPNRYLGYGFGNISQRIGPYPAEIHHRRFAITGTQTGHLSELGPEHYAIVDVCVPMQGIVHASGPVKPSSESMAHGLLYDADSRARCVIHVHSPELWHAADRIDLPTTDPAVPYGSPELSSEMARLYDETDLCRRRVLKMGGHEDGIISFGRTVNAALQHLLRELRAATG
jgi:ribulose-5-phosphate 4-epimerase/fuculose-1-phosphate aldolase